MLPLRCLSLLLLGAALIRCDDEATESLIEMKDDQLVGEKTTEAKRVVDERNGEKKDFLMSWFAKNRSV